MWILIRHLDCRHCEEQHIRMFLLAVLQPSLLSCWTCTSSHTPTMRKVCQCSVKPAVTGCVLLFCRGLIEDDLLDFYQHGSTMSEPALDLWCKFKVPLSSWFRFFSQWQISEADRESALRHSVRSTCWGLTALMFTKFTISKTDSGILTFTGKQSWKTHEKVLVLENLVLYWKHYFNRKQWFKHNSEEKHFKQRTQRTFQKKYNGNTIKS